ncbi:MAG: hypothetical protein IT183_03345 [Acidobacteria bacterium]|jgi:hypothetical protein|nr:hypothetical protein [Acidobacteriota bacterium]
MLDVYRLLASRVGSPDALDLAHDLADWHDAMVRHERSQAALGASCAGVEDCPHFEARDLWRRARLVFGAAADELTFLRASARDQLAGAV